MRACVCVCVCVCVSVHHIPFLKALKSNKKKKLIYQDAFPGTKIIMNQRFSTCSHYSNIVANGQQRAALILRCFKSRDPMLFRAFTTYVQPIVEYCSPVWSPVYKSDILLIESVQRQFTKKLFGLRDLSHTQRLDELNADSLEKRIG